MLGVISGTILLQEFAFSGGATEVVRMNQFGRAQLLVNDTMALIPRHGLDRRKQILPHLINHRANLKALQEWGVSEVVGVNSTGSLRQDLPPGIILIPDDFIMLSPYPCVCDRKPLHIVPSLNGTVRKRCLEAASTAAVEAVDGGTYWQTAGPRLETRAEIRMMSQFADLVGMTMASEAIAAQEMGINYASICSVDNYAHGIGQMDLSMEEISLQAQLSGEKINLIISKYKELPPDQ